MRLTGVRRIVRLARLTEEPLRTMAALTRWRLTRASTRISTYRLGQVRLLARPIDQFGIEEVFLEREYGFLESLFRAADRPYVIDAGANVGAFAAWVFGVSPNARVCSIEAAADTADLLRRSAALNPSAQWDVLHAALWTEDGSVGFTNGSGLSTARQISSMGKAVPSMTLTSVLASRGIKRAAVLKMDIEGAEGAVLARASEDLKAVDTLVVEVHPPAVSLADVCAVLHRCYPTVLDGGPRRSRKPLLVAAREPYAQLLRQVLRDDA